MKILSILVLITCCAAIFALISNALNSGDRLTLNLNGEKHKGAAILGKELTNIFWFVQVSDIHVSRYYGQQRAPDLAKFCDSEVNVIQPELVIASGDLTDAKFRDLRGSKQFPDEWETYHEVVKKCKEKVKTWLDIRGNHDAFDIPDLSHPSNLFRKFSSQGSQHSSSYLYHHVKPYGKYSFLAIDAAPDPGPKRPFNFFGYMKQTKHKLRHKDILTDRIIVGMEEGGKAEEELIHGFIRESRTSNMTVAFGHYPTSLVALQSGNSLRQIIRNATAYLCGHLHTLAGIIPNMYARHKSGLLELELGDWKDERRYRVLAVDHDMFSFVDQNQGHWPVVMVTNPKHASMMSSTHEPLWRMMKSTHIRILVFTPGSVTNVEVYIDEIHAGKAVHSEGPLYVLSWIPEQYKTGVHSIRVVAQDSYGSRRVIEQPFSLDGTSPLLPFRGRFVLMMDIGALLQTLYVFLVLVYVCVMLLLRRCQNIKLHLFTKPIFLFRPVTYFYNQWLYRVWMVSQVSPLFYTLVGFILYVSLGPWFLGELLEGHTGVVFVWGMFVYGSYLPLCLTYVYGAFQASRHGVSWLVTYNIPLTMFLGYYLHYRQMDASRRSGLFHKARHIFIPFLVLVGFHSYLAMTEFPAAYGTRAFILGPVRTGSLLIAPLLYYFAGKVKPVTLASPHHN